MKVGVLTSSRADYGIYYPLLCAMKSDPSFTVDILAFGTHLSVAHGHTIDFIEKDGFSIKHAIQTLPTDDSPEAVSNSMASTISGFSHVWAKSEYDLVFCLGDRYEMFAACASSVPFNVRLAHIHGGEETLGAIDDAFRHSITHMASYHFTAAQPYFDRVVRLKGSDAGVFNVGALSIDNLKNASFYSVAEFRDHFNIDLSKPSILITFHPETISLGQNEAFVNELIAALERISGFQFIITMPNADPLGNMVRRKLNEFIKGNANAYGVESFGSLGYLSCMKHCSFMLGNTSSGFIEAAFFPKYVINLGDRQRGRILTDNIVQCKITVDDILNAVGNFSKFTGEKNVSIYGEGNTAHKIISAIKTLGLQKKIKHGGL